MGFSRSSFPFRSPFATMPFRQAEERKKFPPLLTCAHIVKTRRISASRCTASASCPPAAETPLKLRMRAQHDYPPIGAAESQRLPKGPVTAPPPPASPAAARRRVGSSPAVRTRRWSGTSPASPPQAHAVLHPGQGGVVPGQLHRRRVDVPPRCRTVPWKLFVLSLLRRVHPQLGVHGLPILGGKARSSPGPGFWQSAPPRWGCAGAAEGVAEGVLPVAERSPGPRQGLPQGRAHASGPVTPLVEPLAGGIPEYNEARP